MIDFFNGILEIAESFIENFQVVIGYIQSGASTLLSLPAFLPSFFSVMPSFVGAICIGVIVSGLLMALWTNLIHK